MRKAQFLRTLAEPRYREAFANGSDATFPLQKKIYWRLTRAHAFWALELLTKLYYRFKSAKE